MRLFIATLSTETNTFSPMPTALSGFEDYYLRYGTATQEPPNLMTEALHVWRSEAEALGWKVTESLAAIAEPAGPTVSKTYQHLKSVILSDLETAGGADIILLQLHGAMVAEDEDDCEGDIAEAVRTLCPNAVVGMALDLHCHLTSRMMTQCDLIVCFKEYPHDDATDRAMELFALAHQTADGSIAPVMRSADCGMVNLYLTKTAAMRAFVDHMKDLEDQPDILSVSLAHGFPWADVADVGARTLVIANGNDDLAQNKADRLAERFFEKRHEVTTAFSTLDEALAEIPATAPRPVVLADMGDNSGGGAPGDATFMLRALLDNGFDNLALGIIWDPIVVRLCQDAGVGSRLRLRVGGKIGPDSGDPVDLSVRVMKIATGLGQHLGKGLEPLGTLVWLRTGDNTDILINDLRTQVYHPEAFEQMGIDLSAKAIVGVKSLFHFFAPFEKIAHKIIQVATPGGTSPDFRSIELTKRTAPYWPRHDAPLSGDMAASERADRDLPILRRRLAGT